MTPIHRIRELLSRVTQDDVGSYAAALAYNFLFAVFPLMLFLTALLAFLHLPNLQQTLRGPVSNLIPASVLRFILTTLQSITHHKSPALLSVGALAFLWAMSGAFRQLIDAVNHAYEFPYPRRRKLWQTYAISVGLGLGFGILMVMGIGLTLSGVKVVQWVLLWAFGLHASPWVADILRWAGVLLGFLLVLSFLYAFLPDRPQPFKLWTWGGLFALVVFTGISLGFSFYVGHFSSYNRMYGSFGTVMILMLYLYILAWSLLLGAEINAMIHRHTE